MGSAVFGLNCVEAMHGVEKLTLNTILAKGQLFLFGTLRHFLVDYSITLEPRCCVLDNCLHYAGKALVGYYLLSANAFSVWISRVRRSPFLVVDQFMWAGSKMGTRMVAVIAAALSVATLGVGCAGPELDASVRQETAQSASDPTKAPGALIEVSPIAEVDPLIRDTGARAVHVVYRSTSGVDGSATTVTGSFFVPAGQPPPFGWPIMALAHPTTGIDFECAPSLSSDLYGMAALVAAHIQNGYAVAVTDYQGLGGPGVHPYLEAKTAGLNVIDSVRALRAISRDTSKQWAAYGSAQGGSAVWAANEQAAKYAPELELVGSVSVDAIADPANFAIAAGERQLTSDQAQAYIWVLMSLQRLDPSFNVDDYRHGVVAATWDELSACSGPGVETRDAILAEVTPEDLQPSSADAEERLVSVLSRFAVPQRRASAPMFVLYGGQQDMMRPDWTLDAIGRACAMGSLIGAMSEEGQDPDPDAVTGNDFLSGRWLSARFEGLPAPSNCRSDGVLRIDGASNR